MLLICFASGCSSGPKALKRFRNLNLEILNLFKAFGPLEHPLAKHINNISAVFYFPVCIFTLQTIPVVLVSIQRDAGRATRSKA